MHNIKIKDQTLKDKGIQQQSIFAQVGEHSLHMRRFYQNPEGEPVWMVHGSIEDGRIFYSSSGKGLAPFLAARGYDVFVADLRGRGRSTPSINQNSRWGLAENLKEDFPAYLEKIKEIKGERPQHWMAHSWGGVLQLAYLARHQSSAGMPANGMPATLTFFGSKRRISIFSLSKLFQVDIIWSLFSRLLVRRYGYLPAKKFKIGSDNESKRSHKETLQWVMEREWRDWHDGFDYRKALQNTSLPPLLSLTGANDRVLGHPHDVRILAAETGSGSVKVQVVGEAEGFLHDYDHINLLTHPDAPKDHFQTVLQWLKQHSP